jgi:hypothetical protein
LRRRLRGLLGLERGAQQRVEIDLSAGLLDRRADQQDDFAFRRMGL